MAITLNDKQKDRKAKIDAIAVIIGLDLPWPEAVAMVESSLGLFQLSPTGCKGVFQMSMIAMKDLWLEMQKTDDDWGDILCGVAFLYLLEKRWKTPEEATKHFCDPADIPTYIPKMLTYMKEFSNGDQTTGS